VRDNTDNLDEIRWEIVKAMLEDFPKLRRRVIEYFKLKKEEGRV
jgi:hypothetical protein